MGQKPPEKFNWEQYRDPEQGLDKLGKDDLQKLVGRYVKELSRLSGLFGIKPFSRKRIPERDDVSKLLVFYEGVLRGNGYYITEKKFREWNWEAAEEILAQYNLEEVRQFLEWFFMMKPTHHYWRTRGNVDRLTYIRSAINDWVAVEGGRKSVGQGVDYDRR